MLRHLCSGLTILSLILCSCEKQDVAPPDAETGNAGGGTTVGGGGATDISFNVSKSKMLQLINNVRQAGCKCGTVTMPPVGKVAWNDKLGKAAYDHSAEMKANNYFSHTGLNGSNAGQRITAAGYSWKGWGENIAKGYNSEQAVVTGWLNSEGHCKNIMSPNFREMGVGRQDAYWTQEFGTR